MTHLDTPAPPAQSVRVTQTRTFLIPGEATLAAETRAVLQQVGAALDEHRPLVVRNQGLVALATFRRKISDFWIVADEVRKARPAGLAAGVI